MMQISCSDSQISHRQHSMAYNADFSFTEFVNLASNPQKWLALEHTEGYYEWMQHQHHFFFFKQLFFPPLFLSLFLLKFCHFWPTLIFILPDVTCLTHFMYWVRKCKWLHFCKKCIERSYYSQSSLESIFFCTVGESMRNMTFVSGYGKLLVLSV